MPLVRCSSCFREERWSDSGLCEAVIQPGGQRRPKLHPSLAAWNTLLKAHRGESGPAVADCPACGQPLIASGPLVGAPSWTLRTPSGDVVVAPRGIATPKGPMTWEEADVFLNESLSVREPVRPFTAVWEMGLLTFSTVPFLMWLVAVFLVLWFLYNTTTGTIGY